MTLFDSGDTLTNIYWIESWRMGAMDMSFSSRFLSAVDGSVSIHPSILGSRTHLLFWNTNTHRTFAAVGPLITRGP